MSNDSVAKSAQTVKQFSLGDRVRVVSKDTFNGKRGRVVIICKGSAAGHQNLYVTLDGQRADEKLYFSGYELEAA